MAHCTDLVQADLAQGEAQAHSFQPGLLTLCFLLYTAHLRMCHKILTFDMMYMSVSTMIQLHSPVDHPFVRNSAMHDQHELGAGASAMSTALQHASQEMCRFMDHGCTMCLHRPLVGAQALQGRWVHWQC